MGQGYEPYPDPTINVYNPDTLALVRSFHLSTSVVSDIRSIAVDGSGNIYAADWSAGVTKYDPSGAAVKSLGNFGENLMNIAIDSDGQIAVGGRLGGVYLTDESLDPLQSFQTNQWNVFVTFDHYIGTAPQTVTPTVTVADAGGIYNGSAYSVTAASVVGQGGAVLASLGDPTLSYSYYQGTLTAAQIATATPLPGAPNNAGSYTVVAHFTSNIGGYSNADSAPAPFSITPAAVTDTISNDSQTYGSPANLAGDLGTTISTGVNNETLDIAYASTGDTATANAGGYDITGTLSNGSGLLSNYSVTLNNGTLTVNPYAFTYTIGNDSQIAGLPANLAADLPGTLAGVNGENLKITYASTGDTATATPGKYAINGTLSDGTGLVSNYTVTLNPGTLTVTKYGANVIVNTLLDAAAATASLSPFDTNSNGEISLRSAIQFLDANSGGTIGFDPSLFASGPGTIPLTLGELAITKAITIDGPGASQLTLDAGGHSRDFFVSGGTAANYVAISGLTLTGGDGVGTTNANYNQQGGAILNIGYLTLSHDVIQGNAAQFGGGIHNIHFMTSIDNTITDNRAEARSGSPYGASVYGGGIYNTGILSSMGDTISGNTAQGNGTASGGGISNGSDLILTNDTLSGNSAQGFNAVGGAIDNQIVLDLSNDTISGNTAVSTGGNNGGGVNNGSIGTLSLANSLLVGNTSFIGSASAESDLVGAPPADDNGHNLVNQSAVGILVTDASGNPVLNDNGGPTETIALVANSPAIGAAGALATLNGALSDTATTATVNSTTFLAAGDMLKIDNEILSVTAVDMYTNTITISRAQDGTAAASHASGAALSLANDQRGLPRHAAADIGAFETQIQTPTVTVVDPGGVYTGSAYPVTAASVVGQGGAVLASLGDASLSYSYYQGKLTAAQVATATPLPGAPTDAGSYTVVAHYTSDDAGYTNADSAPTSFSITPAKVTYTIGNDSQTYGSPADLTNDLGTTINTGVNGETLDVTYASAGDSATANVGGYAITGTLADGSGLLSNYTVTLNSGTLTVNPYAFTYTIGNDSQTYGSPADLANDLGTTINTGVNGETLGITYASTGNTSTANAGSYDITGTLADGSGSLSNYTVTLNNGTLRVDP
ncbi:MAG TPA: hypothetical protein VJ783_05145, partial [Pirellulales bacterium]|nr:hypothetical protein [Pirellulales bacterium]